MKKKSLFDTEITLAVIFIILLTVLSVNKVRTLKSEAQRGLSVKKLSVLRDAVTIYRGDNEGRCPASIKDLTPDYIDEIPAAYGSDGSKNNQVLNGVYAEVFDGSGGWVYVNNPKDADFCKVFLNTK